MRVHRRPSQQCALQAARKARARWAMVVTFVGSPVLGLVMLYGGFCILANETLKGVLRGTNAYVMWPFKWMLSMTRTIFSWFQFGWMSIPIVVFLRKFSALRLASSLALFWCCMLLLCSPHLL
jgi:hypothetical protein